MPKWYEKPLDAAACLSSLQITITDILARAPGHAEKFAQTFRSSGKTISIMLNFGTIYTGSCTPRIDGPVLFTNRARLPFKGCAQSIHFLNNGASPKLNMRGEIL
jgi:hypothetical protein